MEPHRPTSPVQAKTSINTTTEDKHHVSSQPKHDVDIRPDLQQLGHRLQNARRQASMTQRVFADELEVTPQTVRNSEAGRNEPPHRLRQR